MRLFFVAIFLSICGASTSDKIIHSDSCEAIECNFVNSSVNRESEVEIENINNKSDIKLIRFKWSKFQKNSLKTFLRNFENLIEISIESCSGVNEQSKLTFNFINIKKSDLTIITDQTFAGGYRVERISLNYNKIRKIHKNAFANLLKVEKINLKSNEISWLHHDTFASCRDLELIDLSSNLLQIIAAESFSRNSNLKEILISDNQIIAVAEGFLDRNQFAHLYRLDFSKNYCVNEDFEINHSANLQVIDEHLKTCHQNFLFMHRADEALQNYLTESFEEIERENKKIVSEKQKKEEILSEKLEFLRETLKSLRKKASDYQQVWLENKNLELSQEFSENSNLKPENLQISDTKADKNFDVLFGTCFNHLYAYLIAATSISITFLCFKPRKYIKQLLKRFKVLKKSQNNNLT